MRLWLCHWENKKERYVRLQEIGGLRGERNALARQLTEVSMERKRLGHKCGQRFRI